VYEGSDFFMGVKESIDGSVVDPAAVRFTAEHLHVESEILKQQRLSMQERRAIGLGGGGAHKPHTGGGDDDDGGDGGAAAGEGRGAQGGNPRGRGARGKR
jgi:hypothetical protein